MLRFILLTAVLAGSVVAPAAAEAPAVPGAHPPALTDAQLDDSRGGFIIPGGQELSFSAVMRSYVDGRLVLESRLSVGDQGRTMSSSDGPLPASTLEGLAAAGLNLGSSADGGDVFVSDDRRTVFVHNANNNQLASLLVNTASDRDLRQETALSLVMPGFEATQAAMRETLAARALADDLRTALAGR